MKQIAILIFFLSCTLHVQAQWFFGSGEAVNLTNATVFKNGVKTISGSLDPSSTAVSAPAGSMYFATSGTIYVKQDAGSSTNWLPLGIAAAGSLTTINGQSGPAISVAATSTGTDFTVSASSNTISLNIPTSSASNRGLLSSSDWSTFNGKEPAITATTSADYFRGDKTFQPLNKAAVGLSSVDDTSDASKPVSTLQQAAIDAVQASTDGKITGVASSVDGEVTLFSGTTGKASKRATGTGFAKLTSGVLSTSSTVNLASEATGVLPMANGGSDKALTSILGGVVYTDANSMEVLGAGTSGQVLTSNGAAAPSWQTIAAAAGDVVGPAASVDGEITLFSGTTGKLIKRATGSGFVKSTSGVYSTSSTVNLASEVTGVLPLANGGSAKALTASNGAIAYSDTDSLELLSPGTSGQILQTNGAGAPSFVNKSISAKSEAGSSVTLEELQVPNNLLTQTATGKYLNETGNENILANGSFEHSTYSTGWTISGTATPSAQTGSTDVAHGKKVLKFSASGLGTYAFTLVQDSTIYADAWTNPVQGVMSFDIKSTHDANITACPRMAGSTLTSGCLTLDSSYRDGTWKKISIPVLLGSTSNGVSIVSGNCAGVTCDTYIDNVRLERADVLQPVPMITDWQDYTATIGATVTPPTLGSGVVINRAQWRRVGANMELRWDYRQSATTGNVLGSGLYLFPLPSGYQMDTSKVTVNGGTTATTANYDSLSLGSFTLIYGTTYGMGNLAAHSATQLKATMMTYASDGSWASGSYDFNQAATVAMSLRASVPIQGWSNSINTVTQQCQNDLECANEFNATIAAGGAVTNENLDWINGSCTNASPRVCTLNTVGITAAMSCSVDGAIASASTTTSVSVQGNAASALLRCFKVSPDYKSRRSIVGSFGTQSKATNGYQVLPGGMIMQWVTGVAAANNINQSISFPMVFPNAVYHLSCQGYRATSTTDDIGLSTSNLTTSGFQVTVNDSAGSYTPMCFAIGY